MNCRATINGQIGAANVATRRVCTVPPGDYLYVEDIRDGVVGLQNIATGHMVPLVWRDVLESDSVQIQRPPENLWDHNGP